MPHLHTQTQEGKKLQLRKEYNHAHITSTCQTDNS
uniref:Uncharacterized protein n=1 Tax=Rhizophora mucronata TaxID=61149 RepID=A0A2P2NB31_RHIMU